MDIIVFTNPTESTKMEQAKVVNGITSKMWVERYQEPGEFKLVAPVDSGVREQLPLGSFISHIGTSEIMIVEDHEISDSQDDIADIVITGRSFESFLEGRITGFNRVHPEAEAKHPPYITTGSLSWDQARNLIADHIYEGNLDEWPEFIVPWIVVTADSIDPLGGESEVARRIGRITVHEALMNLLNINKTGIRNIRPGAWSSLWGTGEEDHILMDIYRGENKSKDVVFSHEMGEIVNANYFWSTRTRKNSMLLASTWLERIFTPGGIEGIDQRMMYVEDKNIDDAYGVMPDSGEAVTIAANMFMYAFDILSEQNDLIITDIQIAQDVTRYTYRIDFNLGDTVTISGDYNQVVPMRIMEYVESEDADGYVSYPGLKYYPFLVVD